MSEAIITGYDGTFCMCCGGLMVNFDGESRPYTGDYKIVAVDSLPGISRNDSFPIRVKLDWKVVSSFGCSNFIEVTRVKRL